MTTVEEIRAAAKSLPLEEQERLAKCLAADAEKERRRQARLQWLEEWKQLADEAGIEVGPNPPKREEIYARRGPA